MGMRIATSLAVFVCTLSLGITPAYAVLDFGTSISLSISPEHPTPGDTVRVSVQSSLLELSTGNILWYVDGVQNTSARGATQLSVTAGSLGSTTRVEAVFTEEGFERAVAEAVIRPVEIDLLWESNSYIPPFFRGRALPSAGTLLSLEAVPRFKRSNGTFVPRSEMTFTWRRNGYVVASASGHGKYRAALESPSLFGSDTITVEAKTNDGVFSAQTSTRITSVGPVLNLYEDSPVFGVMYHRAFGAQSTVSEEEVSFAAIPYFAATNNPDTDLIYEWRVGGNAIANDTKHPHEITINARGSAGVALISLVLSHITDLFLHAEGSWSVTFNASSFGTQGNPFGTAQ